MIGILYHKDYCKYDLGFNHPLIIDKLGKTMESFEKRFNKKNEAF